MNETTNISVLKLNSFEEFNQFIASNKMATLGKVFTQYSKLFVNSKKLTVSQSCFETVAYSKNYCSALEIIGQLNFSHFLFLMK